MPCAAEPFVAALLRMRARKAKPVPHSPQRAPLAKHVPFRLAGDRSGAQEDYPMLWLVATIVILLIALVFRLSLLAYAMYTLLGVLLVSKALARSWSENLAAARECNRLSANVGEHIAVVLQIENQGRLPIPWVLLEDVLPPRALGHTPPNLGVEGRRINLVMLKPRSKKTLYYKLACNQRGYYQIGPLVMETGDVFGLHRRYRVATEPHFLLVYPKVVPLAGYDIASRRPVGEIRLVHRLFEDTTRICGVRFYQPGDPLNRVHWKATARTGRLHSKVFEPTAIAGATLLLDFHQASYHPQHEPMRSELAVTAAASLANAVYETGQQVGLVTNGRDAADRIRQEGWQHDYRTRDLARQAVGMQERSDRLRPLIVQTRRGPEQLVRILETLARVELTDGLTLPQLVIEASSRLPRDATVIAILPEATPEAVLALGNLRRSGYAVTVIVNSYDDDRFAFAAGRLLREGIASRHLKDEAALVHLCQAVALR
jgi:uncharacterized protein (DUF58 family)